MNAMTLTRPPTERLIRDAEFARRLQSACEGHAHCPGMHHGRLTWIVRELKSRFDVTVSVESVRKWFAGEAKPRPDKTKMVAELLGVDVGWLQIGIDPALAPRERKIRNAMVDGAVNMVAGFIQMDGGFPAFPDTEGTIDIHAIIRGRKYDFHVALADESGRFAVPSDHEGVTVLGILRKGFCADVFLIPAEVIDQGRRHGGSIEVAVPVETLRRVETFARL